MKECDLLESLWTCFIFGMSRFTPLKGQGLLFAVLFVLGYVADPFRDLFEATFRELNARSNSVDPSQPTHIELNQRLPLGAVGDAILAKSPQYLIVGVPKAGTSVLYFGLCGVHPNITCASFVKEPFYLTGIDAQALVAHVNATAIASFHRRYIERCFNVSLLRPSVITSEASTSYFHSPLAADVIDLLLNKDLKLIVSFREPVSRAYSWYQHQLRKGDAPPTFRDAVEAEVHIVVDCAGSQLHNALNEQGSVDEIDSIVQCIDRAKERHYQSTGRRFKNYVFDSLYVGRYLAWKKRFGDRLHVVLYDEIRDDPQSAIDAAVRFLGLPDVTWNTDSIRVTRHEFQQGSRYEELPEDDEVAGALKELFAPYNRLLAMHLGRDIPWVKDL